MTTRFVYTLLLAVGMLSSGCSDDEVKPSTTVNQTPIRVLVSEKGAAAYALTDAHVVTATYTEVTSIMTVVGKLSNGKTVQLDFSRERGSTTPVNKTNVLEAYLDNTLGTNMSGTTTFNGQSRTVEGTFSVTFPSTGPIQGSFAGVQL